MAQSEGNNSPRRSPVNAVKDLGSRIRENSVVSGIARSLTTSATTYIHAFSRVKKSLTAFRFAAAQRPHATSVEL